jgi:hypothetical protein
MKTEDKTVQKELPVTLTAEERARSGEEIARRVVRVAGLEEEKKKATKVFTDAIADEKRAIGKLARAVHEGREERLVDCIERTHFGTNQVITTRLDTGEIVETRAMKAEERQEPLFPKPTGASEDADFEEEGEEPIAAH